MKKSKDKKKKATTKKLIIEDTIGRDKFIEKVISLINFSDNTKAWHFAIDGEWGAGKSFVLNMIEDRLQDREDIVYIKYDAWKNDFLNGACPSNPQTFPFVVLGNKIDEEKKRVILNVIFF